MGKIIFGVAAGLTLAVAALGQSRNDAGSGGLKGPVETVRDESVVVTRKGGDESAGPRSLDSLDTYDGEGRLLERVRFGPGGAPLGRSVYEYKGPGEKTVTEYAPGGEARREMNFKHEPGEGGRPSRLLVTGEGGGLHSEFVRSYDAEGRLVEELVYGAEGKVITRTVRKYDEGGRMAELSSYNDAGIVLQKYVFAGDTTEVFIYHPDGRLRATLTHGRPVQSHHDARGNWTKQVWTRTEHKPEGPEEVTVITYRTITYR